MSHIGRSELEERVLNYDPKIRETLERDPSSKETFKRITDRNYDIYSPYLKGKSKIANKTGRGIGYLGDIIFFGSAIAAATNPALSAYMLTGLLLKKINLGLQTIGEGPKTYSYMKDTGDVLGGLRNYASKLVSYVPGLTVIDRGLSNIAEYRMIRQTARELREELGIQSKPWHNKVAEAIKDKYSDVKERSRNVISPHYVPSVAA